MGESSDGVQVGYVVEGDYRWWVMAFAAPPLVLIIFLMVLKSVYSTNSHLISLRGMAALLAGAVVAIAAVSGLQLPSLTLLALAVTIFASAMVHMPRREAGAAVLRIGAAILKKQAKWVRVCGAADLLVALFATIWLILLLLGAIRPKPHGLVGGQAYAVVTVALCALAFTSAVWVAYPFCYPAASLGWPGVTAPPPVALGDEDSEKETRDMRSAMLAYNMFKPAARVVAWYEAIFPAILGVQAAFAALADATQRWPEVSLFSRALVDAVCAIILATGGAIYFFMRAYATDSLVSGMIWASEAPVINASTALVEQQRQAAPEQKWSS